MGSLETSLSMSECLNVLREQVERRTFWNRNVMFVRRKSGVVGTIIGSEFALEAAGDPFSKQMRGWLTESEHGTRIEYEWRIPFWSKIWGSQGFDEKEVMHFLTTWLQARPG